MTAVARASNHFQAFRTKPVLGIKSVEESGKIAGYATVFNILDLHNDIMRPGAFRNLQPKLIALLWSHIDKEPIGKILDAREDERGVYFEAQLCFSVQRAREGYVMLKERVFTGISIGWLPFEFSIDPETGVKDVTSGHIFEISLVINPANEEACVTQVKHGFGGANEDINLFRAIDRALNILTS
jgi:HK97 family phage prohead protease